MNEVFKRFSVYINGKKSNWTGLKKYLTIKERPYIIAVSTKFWIPESNYYNISRSENQKCSDVEIFFISEGFELLDRKEF